MHMADALISPAVGGAFWVVAGGWLALAARRLKKIGASRMAPMMGVLGAFVFAAQMVNFSIPGTGSSGHLGGGLLLAILLGPQAALLVIASVLTVQALLFADGGLLALGCNIFNLGILPAFVAYPWVYRPWAGESRAGFRHGAAAVVAAVVALELGALSVTVQTRASGIAELPFGAFAALMLPIHVPIGIVEGLATAAVVAFVARARPDLAATTPAASCPTAGRTALAGLAAMAALLGGVAAWFASSHPDGLEWSVARVAGERGEGERDSAIHRRLAAVQEATAVLPDYGFKSAGEEPAAAGHPRWPTVDAGTSLSGLLGGAITLGMVLAIGAALRVAGRARSQPGG